MFGPDKITENLGEFLDYFMVRKVIAGEELLKAAGTVTGKLMRWLGERGYIDAASAAAAGEQAREAARDLARPGWSVFVTAARVDARWHLLELGVVYP